MKIDVLSLFPNMFAGVMSESMMWKARDRRLLEISIGDYVLTGGELAAMVVIDAVVRQIPGVLGAAGAQDRDSHADGLLEGPHYTRPAEFRGLGVPDVLKSGHHAEVERWRRQQALKRTWQNRPELLSSARLSEEDRLYLAQLTGEHQESS